MSQMSQMSPAQTDSEIGATPTVSVVGEAVLRAEPGEVLVIVSEIILFGRCRPGPRV
jgi:hypothetical protein